MAHLGLMRLWLSSLFLTLAVLAPVALVTPASDAAVMQDFDEEVPPGNPVVGSDRPGDFETSDDTNYVLWSVVAACLIGAGVLLVTIERWEARRIGHSEV